VPSNSIANKLSIYSSPYFYTHKCPLKRQCDSVLYSSDDSISYLVSLSFWTLCSIHCLNIQESKALFCKLDLIPSSDKRLGWNEICWTCSMELLIIFVY